MNVIATSGISNFHLPAETGNLLKTESQQPILKQMESFELGVFSKS